MKDTKHTSVIVAAVLAFCLSFGSLSCMASGLNLAVDFGILALWCLISAVGLSALYLLPKGGRIAFGITTVALILIVMSDSFQEQIEGIFHDTVRFYSQAYGFSMDNSLRETYDHILPLVSYGLILNLTVVWTVTRRYPVALSVFLGIVPLLLCFVVTNTVPSLLFLLLYIFSNGMLVLTQLARIHNQRSGNRLVAYLSVPLILGLGLLALLIPEDGFTAPITLDSFQDVVEWISEHIPFIGQTSNGQLVINFTADLPDEVNLSNLPDKETGSSTILEVTTDHSDKIYLRIRDYDGYDGTSWSSSERSEVFSPPHYSLIDQISSCSIRVLGKRTQILLPYYPNGDVVLEDGVIITDSDDRNYSFDMVVLSDNWPALWRQGGLPSSTTPDDCYLELPKETLQNATSILSNIDFPRGADEYTTAQYIGDYVYDTARYSVSAEKVPKGEDFAIWFLTEAEEGYCVHFATAATVLLRAQGIPARFVEGYAFYTEGGETTEVTQNDGHAWVEYFVDGVGWVVLDPTPSNGDSPSSPEVPTTIPTTPSVTPTKPTAPPTTPTKPTEPSTAPTKPTETDPPTKPSDTHTSPSQSAGATSVSAATSNVVADDSERMFVWIVVLLITLTILVLIPVVIFLQWLLRRTRKLRRLNNGSTNKRVIACYQQTQSICRVLRRKMPKELVDLAEKAGYSQYTLTEAEVATAMEIHRCCARQLRQGRWHQKLIWRFLLALY